MGMDHYAKLKDLGGVSGAILAHDKQDPSRRVVIKRLPDGAQGMEELSALLRARHPNIVKLVESFVYEGFLHVVLQYEAGGDLDSLLSRLVRLHKLPTPLTQLTWFVQMLDALAYCHENSIIHRDVKPSNIFLSSDTKTLYLGDFGSAKNLGAATMTTTFMGSPMWISPEVLVGTPYAYASDIWSMGCVFYEIASLRRPFSAPNFAQLVHRITSGHIAPLPETVGEPIRSLILSMLVADPAQRPTAGELLARTRRALEEERRRCEEERRMTPPRPPAPASATPPASPPPPPPPQPQPQPQPQPPLPSQASPGSQPRTAPPSPPPSHGGPTAAPTAPAAEVAAGSSDDGGSARVSAAASTEADDAIAFVRPEQYQRSWRAPGVPDRGVGGTLPPPTAPRPPAAAAGEVHGPSPNISERLGASMYATAASSDPSGGGGEGGGGLRQAVAPAAPPREPTRAAGEREGAGAAVAASNGDGDGATDGDGDGDGGGGGGGGKGFMMFVAITPRAPRRKKVKKKAAPAEKPSPARTPVASKAVAGASDGRRPTPALSDPPQGPPRAVKAGGRARPPDRPTDHAHAHHPPTAAPAVPVIRRRPVDVAAPASLAFHRAPTAPVVGGAADRSSPPASCPGSSPLHGSTSSASGHSQRRRRAPPQPPPQPCSPTRVPVAVARHTGAALVKTRPGPAAASPNPLVAGGAGAAAALRPRAATTTTITTAAPAPHGSDADSDSAGAGSSPSEGMRKSQWLRAKSDDVSTIEAYLRQYRGQDAELLTAGVAGGGPGRPPVVAAPRGGAGVSGPAKPLPPRGRSPEALPPRPPQQPQRGVARSGDSQQRTVVGGVRLRAPPPPPPPLPPPAAAPGGAGGAAAFQRHDSSASNLDETTRSSVGGRGPTRQASNARAVQPKTAEELQRAEDERRAARERREAERGRMAEMIRMRRAERKAQRKPRRGAAGGTFDVDIRLPEKT